MDSAFLLMVGGCIVSFVAGMVVGRKTKKLPRAGIPLRGRFFDYPQGAVIVETALKRAGSLIPTTRGERR